MLENSASSGPPTKRSSAAAARSASPSRLKSAAEYSNTASFFSVSP